MIKEFISSFSWRDLVYIGIIVGIFLFMRGSEGGLPVQKPAIVAAVKKVDKMGTAYTQIQGTIYTEQQMKLITDSMRRVLGNGKVVQMTTIITKEVHDTLSVPVYIDSFDHTIIATDSNKSYKQSFSGNWQQHTGKFTLDILPDTATYVSTWKTHWFKKDQLYTNVYHTNPLFVPISGDTYQASAKKTIACIGPFAGISYTGKILPVVGIGITLNLIPIKR